MSKIDTHETIVALSSGNLPSGVAIIRISGPKSYFLLKEFTGFSATPNLFLYREIIYQGNKLDKALVVYFKAPKSFTGEDSCEFHLHGSPALVKAVLSALTSYDNVRLATAGEFTNRAFINGKVDLLEVEGISDLINAETESQRVQAFARMSGGLSNIIGAWRDDLLFLRVHIESLLDFSDEDDVDLHLPDEFYKKLDFLIYDFKKMLNEARQGRIIRQGFRIAIAGKPNAGKSSLINRLSKSDLAIVSPEAGTTRDVREVPIDIDGHLVIFIDMAGLRNSESDAEMQGINRAKSELENADLILWLKAADDIHDDELYEHSKISAPTIYIRSKSDLTDKESQLDLSISSVNGQGIDELFCLIKEHLTQYSPQTNSILLSRERDKEAIENALAYLTEAKNNTQELELCAQSLRQASDSLARLLGIMNPEQILTEIFSSFCIGK